VSLSTIDRALRDGRLRRHRIDGGVRIKREDIDEWLHTGARWFCCSCSCSRSQRCR
jgi:excisionase family DNA binding protein